MCDRLFRIGQLQRLMVRNRNFLSWKTPFTQIFLTPNLRFSRRHLLANEILHGLWSRFDKSMWAEHHQPISMQIAFCNHVCNIIHEPNVVLVINRNHMRSQKFTPEAQAIHINRGQPMKNFHETMQTVKSSAHPKYSTPTQSSVQLRYHTGLWKFQCLQTVSDFPNDEASFRLRRKPGWAYFHGWSNTRCLDCPQPHLWPLWKKCAHP